MRKTLVVAALLLTSLSKVAVAAELPKHQSKNADRILVVLNSIGVNDPQVKEFIDKVDSHVDDGYLTFSEQKTSQGKITLHYLLDGKLSSREVELKFVPKNSAIEYTATVNQLMVGYHFKLN